MKSAPKLLVHDPEGLNSGTWPPARDLVTPTPQFFTRSHAPFPTVDPGRRRLQVRGAVQGSRSFSLGDLLREVGWTEEARHVEMIGLDQVERHGRSFGFGGSIDLAKALGDEVLLATHLNGAPLPAKHG